jgi:hypothetical protein
MSRGFREGGLSVGITVKYPFFETNFLVHGTFYATVEPPDHPGQVPCGFGKMNITKGCRKER